MIHITDLIENSKQERFESGLTSLICFLAAYIPDERHYDVVEGLASKRKVLMEELDDLERQTKDLERQAREKKKEIMQHTSVISLLTED